VAAVAFLLVLLLADVGAAQLLWARHHMVMGANDLNIALADTRLPGDLSNATVRNKATADLAAAKSEFAAARGDLDFWAPLLSRLGAVPRYGPQLAAASPAAASAYFATSSALDIDKGVSSVWPLLIFPPPGRTLTGVLYRTLVQNHKDFSDAAVSANQGLSTIAAVPAETGSGTLDRAAAKLRSDLPQLRATGIWLSVAPILLGQTGNQRYLFCWQNAQQIRASGGIIKAAELVTARRGTLADHFTSSMLRHERYFPHLPAPEAFTTLERSWLFRDSNISPDFPTSARLERWFWHLDTGEWVNGAVDFDDQAISDVLQATGPVYLPAYHVSATAANARTLAQHFTGSGSAVYRGPQKLRPGESMDTYRKQFLGYEFDAIIASLQSLPSNRLAALGSAMSRAILRHDILLWSDSPSIERAIEASGASGRLKAAPGDLLYIVDDNRSYNDIGRYLDQSASYRANILPNLWIDSTLTIRYRLRPSPVWVEGQGPCAGRCGNKHDFRDVVRVLVPPGAIVQRTDGLERLSPPGRTRAARAPSRVVRAYGLTQISGWFQMSPGQIRTISITYRIPPNDFAFGDFKQYRLTILRQPGTRLTAVAVAIQGTDGVQINLPDGAVASARYHALVGLDRDQELDVGLVGAGKPDLVRMSARAVRDPNIPWKYLRGLR
jgi:Protein of unknown function (DUF4012)